MDRETFRKQIEGELKNFTKKDNVVYFAWLCAVRALPYMGRKGNFNFWKENDRLKHLYSIFYALDTAAYVSIAYTYGAYDAYDAIADNYYDAADAAEAADAIVAYAANAVANAANAAANAAYAIDDINAADYDYAVYAADYAADAADDYAYDDDDNFTKIILQDIQDIKKGIPVSNTGTSLYGPVWNNFQKALKKDGCSYWGRLYEEIFKNGLKMPDNDALEIRLNVPAEIREQGAAAVASHLGRIEREGAKRLNEARIIILGEKGAGKTCIARKLRKPDAEMTKSEESTPGVDTTLWELEEEDINVHIWDFAGHTITHAVHQFFLSERSVYIIVYDGRTEERNRLDYWLDHVKNYGGNSKAFILVNKFDKHTPEIPINSLKEKYAIAGVFYFSIDKDKAVLESFRQKVINYIKDNPSWSKQQIPLTSYKVKEELERRFAKGDERITRESFGQIAKQCGATEPDVLLRDLHALGICLWYKGMEGYDTLVLNPEWISQGVYKIINWTHDKSAKKYEIALNDFETIFGDDAIRYPKTQHKFLFELMKKYELAYEIRGARLIIPHLLLEDRPKDLPEFWGDSLMLRYVAEQPLPPHTISRFIVRHNEDIKKERKDYLVWRKGVVLEKNGNTALVREDDRTIRVWVKGGGKTEYIDELRGTLNDIFESYKSKQPEVQYRIVGEEGISGRSSYLPERTLVSHSINRVPYYDPIQGRYIDIPAIMQIYNLPAITQIYNINTGNILGGHSSINQTWSTFNFHDCNISLQGHLNDLASSVEKRGNIEDAEVLKEAAEALEEAKACKTPDEIKRKGIPYKLKRIIDEFEDESSTLNKTVRGIQKGIGIAQDIAESYNSIAQWVGLPQVPKPFLKNK